MKENWTTLPPDAEAYCYHLRNVEKENTEDFTAKTHAWL
uniref:Uncharacterized protein n=1 Tax=Anopheles dirus TaxID=7168 RepID=A0A182NY07_9DIPT